MDFADGSSTIVNNGTENLALHIASFLAQALDLDESPAALAPELTTLKRDPNAGIWTIELDSSVGPAAFLVYHYALDVRDDEGRAGRELFDAGLATLEQAAERDAPGPRILAHAVVDNEAYILATTPATFRALTGATPTADIAASNADLPPREDMAERRREAASELFRLLKDADGQAENWLAAIQMEERIRGAPSPEDEVVAFNEEETALALYLLDDRSIQHLLRVLNILIDSARRQAADAVDREPDD